MSFYPFAMCESGVCTRWPYRFRTKQSAKLFAERALKWPSGKFQIGTSTAAVTDTVATALKKYNTYQRDVIAPAQAAEWKSYEHHWRRRARTEPELARRALALRGIKL